MNEREPFTIGIDATNLRAGGGVTHLIELLRMADPEKQGFKQVVVWGGKGTLSSIEERPWLMKVNPFLSDKGLLRRTMWQVGRLSSLAREAECDVLFVPGGSFVGAFRPIVTMSQNLLPFEMPEMLRFRWSLLTLKLFTLRFTQGRSFRKSDGVIFLSEYARNAVIEVTGNLGGRSCTVAHGLNPRFIREPRKQKDISAYTYQRPLKVIYVSAIDHYKHQWHVVEAIALLREQGMPVVLELIGPARKSALKRLKAKIDSIEGCQNWVHYLGSVDFNDLHHHYENADVGVFASSCENMPNILIEMMASGLPIACSNRGPMPEVLGRSGLYFDPEEPGQIADALHMLIKSVSMRKELAEGSFASAQEYSWLRCANETFEFIDTIAQGPYGSD
jgi:glycosyltransferase involved in cell wall biosynthesis